MPDVSSDGCNIGSSFLVAVEALNNEDGFRLDVTARKNRKRCVRCSDSCLSGEVQMIQSRAVAVSRKCTVSAPTCKYEFFAIIILTPFVPANPPADECLPSPGTIVRERCTECLEPRWSSN